MRPRFKDLYTAFTRAAITTAEWCFLIIGASLFLRWAYLDGWQQWVADYVLMMPPHIVVLSLALALPLVLSIIFDAAVAILLSAILYGPLAAIANRWRARLGIAT